MSSASEDESTGPVKVVKRESFRGSQISSPVLVCTTNRDSLVLADGNVDIIGPEAFTSKPSGGSQVKRSQSERGDLGAARPFVTKSASVRAGLGEEASAPTSTSGFRPRPVPPLPTEEEEDDTQPIYSNEGLGMGDLLSEIEGSLFKKEEEQLYNNLPIQETAPPCPPRPERYRPSSGKDTSVERSQVEAQPTGTESLPSSQNPNASKPIVLPDKTAPTSGRSKTPTRQSSINSNTANNNDSMKAKPSVSKNNVANELRQKMLSRSSNLSAPGKDSAQKSFVISGPKSVTGVKDGVAVHRTTSPRTNSSLVSTSVTPATTTINQVRPSINPSSISTSSKNSSNKLDDTKPASIKSTTDSAPPSVSSLKAKFNQSPGGPASASQARKNAPNISGTNTAKGAAISSHVSSEKTLSRSQSDPKAPVHKGLPQKSQSVLKTDTDKIQTKSKVAELKAALDKNQGQSTSAIKPAGKPVPQVKPGVKSVTSERSGVSGPGSKVESLGQPHRPVLPPKPGETRSSESPVRNVPKAATRSSGAASQPKRVQSFRI